MQAWGIENKERHKVEKYISYMNRVQVRNRWRSGRMKWSKESKEKYKVKRKKNLNIYWKRKRN